MRASVFLILATLISTAALPAGNWPQFRGPTHQGRSAETGLPLHWSETTVIAAGPEFKVLARNPLGEKVQASLAISQQRLFIRTADNLYCIGGK